MEYPISRHKNGKWIFVKSVKGTYEQALKEAGRLQKNNKTGWQFRIWDNRD
jgi:hypothetical protein